MLQAASHQSADDLVSQLVVGYVIVGFTQDEGFEGGHVVAVELFQLRITQVERFEFVEFVVKKYLDGVARKIQADKIVVNLVLHVRDSVCLQV